jgi:hypothetical protein
MNIKKFIADLTAGYRKLTTQTIAQVSRPRKQLRMSMQHMQSVKPAKKRDTRPAMPRAAEPADKWGGKDSPGISYQEGDYY